jgi:hypothetical protein
MYTTAVPDTLHILCTCTHTQTPASKYILGTHTTSTHTHRPTLLHTQPYKPTNTLHITHAHGVTLVTNPLSIPTLYTHPTSHTHVRKIQAFALTYAHTLTLLLPE